MNIWIGFGRLTRDVDVKYTDNGKVVAKFTLAIDRPSFAGKPRETDFINCVAFGKTAETLGNHVFKGHRLLVRGSIHTSSYVDKTGAKRYSTNIWVDNFNFIEKRNTVAQNQDSAGGSTPFTNMGEVVTSLDF